MCVCVTLVVTGILSDCFELVFALDFTAGGLEPICCDPWSNEAAMAFRWMIWSDQPDVLAVLPEPLNLGP